MEKRANAINNYILNNITIPELGNTTTYTDQLNRIGKKYLKSKFWGAYPADQIPNLTNKKPYAILNLDKSDGPGSHWIAVAKSNKDTIVYDSFGRKSIKIIPSLKSGTGQIIDTDYDKEQTPDELNCGSRSLSFLILIDNWGSEMALLI